MKIIRYNKKTGDVVSFLSVDEDFDLSTGDNQEYGYLESDIPIGSTKYYVKDGIITERQERPSNYHFWDGKSWVENDTLLSNKVRRNRDYLLSNSDWVVAKYTELGEPMPDEWRVYRQALRDIPSQAGFPKNVIYPKAPS
jgi:hypothetical protein